MFSKFKISNRETHLSSRSHSSRTKKCNAMGRTYSIGGYLNAALRRTSKTLLVEGPTDKAALHRIAIERHPLVAGSAAIDHAGMLDDPQLTGLGNKARVLRVQACADALTGAVPKMEHVLATLTDREWEGICFNNYATDAEWKPPIQRTNRFVTLGHSIENYFFDIECVKEYLKFAFSEYVSPQLISELEERFESILVLATVLSVKIRNDACISRSGSLIDISHLSYQDWRYYLAPSFGAACVVRAIATAGTMVAEVNAAIDAAWDRLHTNAALRWLPHGHIGDDVLWACVAHIALATGVPGAVANDIAQGHKRDRERFKAQWLSKAQAEKAPLDQSVDWLHS